MNKILAGALYKEESCYDNRPSQKNIYLSYTISNFVCGRLTNELVIERPTKRAHTVEAGILVIVNGRQRIFLVPTLFDIVNATLCSRACMSFLLCT